MFKRPSVFIASPLFNPAQIEIIERIENLLKANDFEYYSARKHSGSDRLSPEEKKVLSNWDPVFKSNVDGLDECTVMIAVLEYAMNLGQRLSIVSYEPAADTGIGYREAEFTEVAQVEIPDAGTVWEMGYFKAQNKVVIGFHSNKPGSHLNLMLSHGCDALISGFENLSQFLSGFQAPVGSIQIDNMPDSLRKSMMADKHFYWKPSEHHMTGALFDWSATEQFDAASRNVE